MNKQELDVLDKVDLREVWNHEALDFTNWLAKPENMKLLGDEIGIDIDIDSVKTEEAVGDFHLDILAQEEGSERKIIIENQLEPTDHDHLGKVITYASGHSANIIIWIVEEARPEHQKAVDWLNEHTDEEINLFLIEMEVWKIGNSLPAPKFNIIVQPNNWVKEVKRNIESEELTETKKLQLEFWTRFNEFAKANKTILRLRDAKPHHWYDLALGSSKAHISLSVNTKEGAVGCEIWISNNKELFNALLDNKESIEKELGANLDWMELQAKKASRIKLTSRIDMTQKESWDSAFGWLQSWGEKFHKIFGKYIRTLDI